MRQIIFCLGVVVAISLMPLEAAGHICIDSTEQIADEIRDGMLEELAILIHAEAGNQDFEGRVLVGEVVLNRVLDPHFPDNIHDVIFQKGQFSCITDGGYNKACWNVSQCDFDASKVAWDRYQSGKLNTEALYFSAGHCANGEFLFKHGDHYFGK